jgi:hypothetical protein
MRIAEGRESDTHSASPIFEKTGREPNRFEIVFSFRKFRDVNEPDVGSWR